MCGTHISLILISIVVILVVWNQLGSSCGSEGFVSYQPVPYVSSIQPYNPKVQGVSLPNRTNIFKISALNAGMLDASTMNTFFPANPCKGVNAYETDQAVVQNTLELSPTLESQRLSLANALAGTNIETPANRLWIQRNFVDNLNQPGLSPNMIQPTGVYSCF